MQEITPRLIFFRPLVHPARMVGAEEPRRIPDSAQDTVDVRTRGGAVRDEAGAHVGRRSRKPHGQRHARAMGSYLSVF